MSSSKSFSFADEISNDSGLSSDTSRDSLNLLLASGTSDNIREDELKNVSLTAGDDEDTSFPDSLYADFIGSKLPEDPTSSDLSVLLKGPTTFELDKEVCQKKKQTFGKRKATLEEDKTNDDHDSCNYGKRPRTLKTVGSKKSSVNFFEKKIKNEVDFKLPLLGTPQNNSSNTMTTASTKTIDIKVVEESTLETNVIRSDVVLQKTSSLLSTKSNFSTAFEFDSSLVERREILGKRRIPLDDISCESPKNRRKDDRGGLYGHFKRPKISSTASSSTSVKSSFEFSSDNLGTEVQYGLPLVPAPQKSSTAFGSISGETLVKTMEQHGEDFNKKYILVDCRYPYEYKGGHIKGAVNFYNKEEVSDLFFPEDGDKASDIKKKIPIFYCEFSQKRGPGMASSLRSIDRKMNVYPEVSYKELYVLDRGYKKFFTEDKLHDFCEPPAYVPMLEKSFSDELKKFKHHHQSDHRRVRRILSRDKSSMVRSLEFKRRSFDFESYE